MIDPTVIIVSVFSSFIIYLTVSVFATNYYSGNKPVHNLDSEDPFWINLFRIILYVINMNFFLLLCWPALLLFFMMDILDNFRVLLKISNKQYIGPTEEELFVYNKYIKSREKIIAKKKLQSNNGEVGNLSIADADNLKSS